METVREKLVIIFNDYWGVTRTVEEFVNVFVSNGVTIAADTNVGDKWVRTSERKPTKEDADELGCVLVCIATTKVIIAATWYDVNAEPEFYSYWQPTPQPPKEVR